MAYLSGWTVQCLNPECPARGRWLRIESASSSENCGSCGAPLHNVPPPLPPRTSVCARDRWPAIARSDAPASFRSTLAAAPPLQMLGFLRP